MSERAAITDELWTELDALPDEPEVLDARAEVSFTQALIDMDARKLPQARLELARMSAFGDELGDPEWQAIAEWKSGLADGLAGDVQAGIARMGEVAHAAVAAGLGVDGRDRLPRSVDRRGRRARLPGGGPLDRRRHPLCGFDRAVALRPRDAGDAGDGLVGRARIPRTRSAERGGPSSTRAAGAAP